MPDINATCLICNSPFVVKEEDQKFLDKVAPIINGVKYSIPAPTLCPDCRQQRRQTFRNERTLYPNTCKLTGKAIISTFSSDKPYNVYDREVWWGDSWNPLDYSRDFDFSRGFFEQFDELLRDVPVAALIVKNSENCTYNNHLDDCKNCYLSFTTFESEEIYYSNWVVWAKNCFDNSFSSRNELCYEILNAENSYNSSFLQNCENISDSYFLYDCTGCSNCFGCVGLRHKKYHFFNEALTEEEYKKRMEEIFPLTSSSIEKYKEEFQKLKSKFPHRAVRIINCENCTGDYIKSSKNCYLSFDILEGEDIRYCYDGGVGKDYMDCHYVGGGKTEVVYECHNIELMLSAFCDACWVGDRMLYCNNCFSCSNCFGCVGLRHEKYCIFNKQYSKEEYETLVPKIIEHMRETNEWGEFFPSRISPFTYNETLAAIDYPLTKNEALSQGYTWKDKDEKEYQPATLGNIPENINEVPNSIIKEVLACENCGKNYKIISQELDFYRKTGLPIPRKCPDCRYKARVSMRNPRKLWNRSCDKCAVEIQTSYSPERPERVYCEKCYLEAVY